MIPSAKHEDWHKQAIPQLFGKKPVQGQIEAVELIFYPQTKRAGDLTNKAESIMDLLVDAGILQDDNWFVIPKVVLRFGAVDPQNPRAEVSISAALDETE